LNAESGTIYAVWNTFAGGSNTLATANTSGVGTYYTTSGPNNLFDSDLNTRFSSEGNSAATDGIAGLNTGFCMTVVQCQPVLIGFRFGNAYPYSEREPLRITIEGTNCTNVQTCVSWALLYNGSAGLDIQMNSLGYGEYQPISNNNIYKSYRFLVTEKRNVSNYVTYDEVQLFGYSNQTSPNQTGSSSKFSCFSFLFEIDQKYFSKAKLFLKRVSL
jgi:hypothetical protein